MAEWSPDARSSFEDYMRQIRPRLEAEGADPDEVSAGCGMAQQSHEVAMEISESLP